MGYMYYQSQISTIYHVYLNGNEIGIVDHPEVIEKWINQKVENESSKRR
jgi:hypothetical protein